MHTHTLIHTQSYIPTNSYIHVFHLIRPRVHSSRTCTYSVTHILHTIKLYLIHAHTHYLTHDHYHDDKESGHDDVDVDKESGDDDVDVDKEPGDIDDGGDKKYVMLMMIMTVKNPRVYECINIIP